MTTEHHPERPDRAAPGAPGGPAAARRVAIVGNGPVGQTTALLLARWGVPSVLLDERPERDLVGSKSICQQRDVLDVWEAIGVGRRLADEGVTWTTARTFYRDAELFAYALPDAGRSSFPPFVNISQSRTEQLLDERIAAEPLVDTRWAHHVTGLSQDDGGVTVTCQTPEGHVEIRAGYAVACAGARGDGVRQSLGVTFDGTSFDDRFLICDIRAELPNWATERRFYFDPEWNPGRQVLIHPCPGSTFRIDWQVPSDYDLDAEEASGALDARIRAILGDQHYEIVWKSVYRFHSRIASRMRVGRVLLAGDCAHLVAPFGARGLNSGVADAENAAWKIAFALHGWAGPDLLESYHDERHAAAVENLEITTATMDFLVPHTEEQRRLRLSVLDRAVTDPATHPEVNSGRLSEPYWYATSPLTSPDPARPFAGRPPRGSVPPAGPGVIVPDAPITAARAGAGAGSGFGSGFGATGTGAGSDTGTDTVQGRFREIARDGFLLLATPGVDLARVREAAAEATPAPVRLLRLDEIDVSGALRAALGTRPGELWVVRPDAYVAAALPDPDRAAVAAALRRALGGAARPEPATPTRPRAAAPTTRPSASRP